MQRRAIDEGFSSVLVEDAFMNGRPELLARLYDAARELTLKQFRTSGDTSMLLYGQQTAFTPGEIRRLALDYNRIITNPVDFENVVGYVDRDTGGGGHADDTALRHFSKSLGIENLELVREVVVEDETLLMGVDGVTTALAGVSMVMWQPGHWSAIASKASLSFFIVFPS